MRLLRRIHTYLGCFFAPLLLFYVLTGWYQTVNHDRLKSPAEAETLVQRLRTVHVDQIYPTDREVTRPSSPKMFQVLVVAMAVALVTTVLLGIVLAFRSTRNRWPVWVSLILGFAVPAALLWIGHPR
jgi:glycerol uptake facilitator-like aquaporin